MSPKTETENGKGIPLHNLQQHLRIQEQTIRDEYNELIEKDYIKKSEIIILRKSIENVVNLDKDRLLSVLDNMINHTHAVAKGTIAENVLFNTKGIDNHQSNDTSQELREPILKKGRK